MVMISGKFLPMSLFFLHRLEQRRQAPERLLVVVRRVLGHQVAARCVYSGSRCCGIGSGKFQTTARALALPKGGSRASSRRAGCRRTGRSSSSCPRRPVVASRSSRQVVPPAELLQQHVVELGIAGLVMSEPTGCEPSPASRLRRRARRRSWRGSCRRRPSRGLRWCRTGSASPGASSPACPSTATAGRSSRRRAEPPCRRLAACVLSKTCMLRMCAFSRSGRLAGVADGPDAAC